jgi:hypothetical protein
LRWQRARDTAGAGLPVGKLVGLAELLAGFCFVWIRRCLTG